MRKKRTKNIKQELFTNNLKVIYARKNAESNLSKKELAKRLNVDPSTISRWFNYEYMPTNAADIEKLANILGSTAEELLGNKLEDREKKELTEEKEFVTYRVTDKSMYPLFDRGDLIFLRPIKHWETFLIYGKPYLIETKADKFRFLRTIMKHDDEDKFLLIPLNHDNFEVQSILKTQVNLISLAYKSTKDLI